MAIATPPPGKSKTSNSIGSLPSVGVKVRVSVPGPGTTKSVARYWSPKAWRPMTIGLVQPGTSRGTLLMTIGSRKITPPRMLRMVPFGRAPHLLQAELLDPGLVGRDRRALDADAVLLDRVGRVDRDLVVGCVAVLDAEVVVLEVDVEVRAGSACP